MEEAARRRAGAKSETTKHQAYDKLELIIAQKTGGTTEPRADESTITLGWFTRNCFFPLREGSTWKQATAETHKSAIEQDILRPLGGLPLKQVDKVTLQTRLNDLAKRLSEGRVKHARFYFKRSSRRPSTRSSSRRIRHESSLCPSKRDPGAKPMPNKPFAHELFALRWDGFNMDQSTLKVTHTAYRGKLRDFGKTQKAADCDLPEGLVNELWLWKQ